MSIRFLKLLCAVVAVATGLGAGGCSSYQLRGHVVRGDASFIQVVDRDDPRLQEPGLPGAQVALTLDPEKLNRKMLGSAMTDGNGDFAIAVEETGAGFLQYDIGLRASGKGMISAWNFMRLPSSGKRILITLQRGQDTGAADDTFMEREDLWEEAERYR
ncbi:MAG: hypothetical protein KDA21_13630 [Phycisphaerales bacterium]|nr:hypothetical protein [Phycisphaerales bacterium]